MVLPTDVVAAMKIVALRVQAGYVVTETSVLNLKVATMGMLILVGLAMTRAVMWVPVLLAGMRSSALNLKNATMEILAIVMVVAKLAKRTRSAVTGF